MTELRDVFISYGREDAAYFEKIVRYLENNGFSVFWDQNLRGGDHWPSQLERQLEGAK